MDFILFISLYFSPFQDSMTVCLFCLAITDFTLSFTVTCGRVLPAWETFFSTEYVDPMAVWSVAFDWMSDSFFHSSGWITTFLGIERCICVTFPFKVKYIFTRNRAIFAVLLIYTGTAFLYLPMHATNYLVWNDVIVGSTIINGTVMNITKSRLEMDFLDDRIFYENIHGIINGHILPIVSLILFFGSVLWMTYGLYKSSKFRTAMTKSKANNSKPNNTDAVSGTVKDSGGGSDNAKRQDDGLNNKTIRLVKVVLILAIVFFLCNLPRIIAMNAHVVNPEIRHFGKEYNLSNFLWHFVAFTSVINASVNIFIYLTVNSAYRAEFKELFHCAPKNQKPTN